MEVFNGLNEFAKANDRKDPFAHLNTANARSSIGSCFSSEPDKRAEAINDLSQLME